MDKVTEAEHYTSTLTVAPQLDRMRLDLFLDHCFGSYTRSFFKNLIDQGLVTRNGVTATKASTRVQAGDIIEVAFPPQRAVHPLRDDHAPLGIEIVDEQNDFIVISKPAGLLVHPPAHGSSVITLSDWLVTYYPEAKDIGDPDRPGLIHRLDKDTSGLLVIARTEDAFTHLQEAFKQRDVRKTYFAIVRGHPPSYGTITYNIERDPICRQQMTHAIESGRRARTEYDVVEYFKDHALVRLRPITGRTHQLRVHCYAIGHPVLGDTMYGKKSHIIDRQALHAHTLAFSFDGASHSYTAPFPDDIQRALTELRKRSPELLSPEA